MSTIDHSEDQPKNQPVRHWKSLEEWRNDPEVQKMAENEFLMSPFSVDKDSPTARRDFLKLMGAGLALSSAGCIRRPVQKIIPYVNRPKEIVLGVADYYTSSLKDQGEGFGIIVKTREGRPIKLEGNPAYPLNRGALSARTQAHVLSLYDPDRLREPKRNLQNEKRTNRDTISATWKEIDGKMSAQLKKGGVVVLTSSLASPSTEKLIGEFTRAFSGRHAVWDAIDADDMIEANRLCYGDAELPLYRFDEADLIVSIDGDFLGTLISPVAFSSQFSSRRNPEGNMNRLVVFESMMSLTGQNADERYPIRVSEQLDVAMALLHELIGKHGANVNSTVADTVAKYVENGKPAVDRAVLGKLAAELWQNRGKSLVISGGLPARSGQAVELQMAVNLLNWLLENDGKTVNYKAKLNTLQGSYSGMRKLIDDMNAGKVKTLVIYKTNPAYVLPKSAGFVEALNKVELVIYAGDSNETALVSDYMMPMHHDMENWGDSEFVSGVLAIQQPTIRPLYPTRSFEESLLGWLKAAGKTDTADWHAYLQMQWKNRALGAANFDAKWDEVLQTGVKGQIAALPNGRRQFRFGAFKVERQAARPEFEVALYQKIGIGDGHYANLPWLQEFPDPVTKIVWDNYVNVAPAAAERLQLHEGDVVELNANGVALKLPVHIQAGVHPHVLAVAVGYGRKAAGKVGDDIGQNAFLLAGFADRPVFSGFAGEMKKTGEFIPIANVQGHQTMAGRPIVAETTLAEYKENPKAGIEKPHFEGEMWPAHKYPGHKWGMAIDVNACTGCSSCIIACQAENNIPTVGKKYVLQGREMHWLRIDRYYSEQPDNPETVHQIMLCQHCDNAPCETVCPVVATTHSDEGLNEMTYNRCVGTRYCSNNCPYKVRRFNWFAYNNKFRDPQPMVLNPEVTVRSRGVMEKCTFCLHRIKEVKNVARDEERPVKDGEIQTACQQSCPGGAIVFGDTNDPDSKVSKLIAQQRTYTVLKELNTKPAVHYLTKIRNRDARPSHEHGGHH